MDFDGVYRGGQRPDGIPPVSPRFISPLDKATDERYDCQERILDEVAHEVLRMLASPGYGFTGIDATKLMRWLGERRLALAVEYGRITPNQARAAAGLRDLPG